MFNLTEARALPCAEFLQIVRPTDPDGMAPCAVLSDAEGVPNRYRWPLPTDCPNAFTVRNTQGQQGAYFTPATFKPAPDGSRKRGLRLVYALKSLWVDVEGSEAKGGYEGRDAVLAALGVFVESTGLVPTAIVLTGSGGAHAYFVLDQELPPDTWKGYADALVTLTERHGLKIDKPVTTDPSRIMRVPGSIHRKTGATVAAYRTGEGYSLEELGKLLHHAPDCPQPGRWSADDLRVNDDLNLDSDKPRQHTPFSLVEVVKHCAAVRKAIANRGATTPYQPWMLALRMAALSVEGEELGHAISQGHPDYDPGEVARKMAGFTGGPPSCETWHAAWGDASPCKSCLYGGIGQ